jgi:hypothetical protein
VGSRYPNVIVGYDKEKTPEQSEWRAAHHLLAGSNKFSSTDPLDEIYALLGLAIEKDCESIPIDYAKSVVDLYVEVVQHMISSGQKLEIIGSMPSSRRPQLPSWVPDFSPDEFSGETLCNAL